MKIQYRIVNDGGLYMETRPWHVEINVGYGWRRCAVCETRVNAESYIGHALQPDYPEDSLGLGELNG
jgi:hypothetical protein